MTWPRQICAEREYCDLQKEIINYWESLAFLHYKVVPTVTVIEKWSGDGMELKQR